MESGVWSKGSDEVKREVGGGWPGRKAQNLGRKLALTLSAPLLLLLSFAASLPSFSLSIHSRIIHSFIHSFIHQSVDKLFIEPLLCTGYKAGLCMANKGDRSLPLWPGEDRGEITRHSHLWRSGWLSTFASQD